MVLRSIYRIRHAEIFVALGCLVMGLWLLHSQVSMATPAYAQLLEMAGEMSWGAIFLLNGLIHILSLYINGCRWWTPFLRLFACIGSTVLYLSFALGFYLSGPQTTAIPTYLVLGSAMSASCAYRAYVDCITGLRRKYHGIV